MATVSVALKAEGTWKTALQISRKEGGIMEIQLSKMFDNFYL